jgi:hypothetical protein
MLRQDLQNLQDEHAVNIGTAFHQQLAGVIEAAQMGDPSFTLFQNALLAARLPFDYNWALDNGTNKTGISCEIPGV